MEEENKIGYKRKGKIIKEKECIFFGKIWKVMKTESK